MCVCLYVCVLMKKKSPKASLHKNARLQKMKFTLIKRHGECDGVMLRGTPPIEDSVFYQEETDACMNEREGQRSPSATASTLVPK